MSPNVDAFLRSWPAAPWLTAATVLAATIYMRGWRQLSRRDPERWTRLRLLAFLGGLVAFYLALASPIETFSSMFLQMHMLQHLLLIMCVPPLICLSWPMFPLLRGLPEPIRTYWVLPVLRSRTVRMIFATLTHPLVAWPTFVSAIWLWHLPWLYEWGLRSDLWHIVQHVCFFATALLFWFPVVRPYPTRPKWSEWLLFPYLLLADVQNTLLAAWLTFSPRVIYSYYLQVPMVGGITALEDQQTAGVLMWVPGSVALLLPLIWIGVRYLINAERERAGLHRIRPSAFESRAAAPFDLLQLPGVGRFLQWRHCRRALQLTFAFLAALVVLDGLRGPQVTGMNLAGVLPWIHWRGLLILCLLAFGNVFCMACPFTLPRSLAKRWLPDGRKWPHWLRNKWISIFGIVVFLWAYEAFALWDNPWLTAWIVIGYFLAAFVIDGFFTGASFCKYVCPIGQFNFVQSLVSPLQTAVRRPAVCATCQTHDCLRGNEHSPGCETELFLPRKVGNMDCTLCLDCVRACPQQNVGVFAALPVVSLDPDTRRSGIGRMSQRFDLTALILVLVFGAFANAAGMVSPVVTGQDWITSNTGISLFEMQTLFYGLTILVIPLAVVYAAACWTQRWTWPRERWSVIAARYAYTLVPIGFSMWLGHYTFHLFTSWESVVPVTQRFLADFALHSSDAPDWQCACCANSASWITYSQLLMLDFGVLASLYGGFRTAELSTESVGKAVTAFAPWAVLVTTLFMIGVWITFQPMEMRGTLLNSP